MKTRGSETVVPSRSDENFKIKKQPNTDPGKKKSIQLNLHKISKLYFLTTNTFESKLIMENKKLPTYTKSVNKYLTNNTFESIKKKLQTC
jgi:hypothetical protein